jgi:DNA-binding response OmpR family regulator
MADVLVVEDDGLLSHAYQLILEKDGHRVQVAENGQRALELVKAYEPEIILLDLLMPIMGGIEFLEKYDPIAKHPKTTVVILSNLGDEREVQKAMSLGAYKYIVKAQATPIQLSMLVNNLIRKNITGKAVSRDK